MKTLILLLGTVYCDFIYLIGGGLKEKDDKVFAGLWQTLIYQDGEKWNSCHLDREFCPKVAFFDSASESLEESKSYFEGNSQKEGEKFKYLRHGFNPILIHAAIDTPQGSMNDNEMGLKNIEIVNRADVLFFNGGDQAKHLKTLYDKNENPTPLLEAVYKRVSEGAIYVGTSAGSAAAGNIAFGEGSSKGYLYYNLNFPHNSIHNDYGLHDMTDPESDWRYRENGSSMKGFGVLKDFMVDTHFENRSRLIRLASILVTRQVRYGIGIDESTAVLLNTESGTLSVFGIGNVFLLDSTDANYDKSVPRIQNLDLVVLSNGSSYNLNSKVIQTGDCALPSISKNFPWSKPDTHSSSKLIFTLINDQSSSYIAEHLINESCFIEMEKSRDYIGAANHSTGEICAKGIKISNIARIRR